MMVSPSSSKTSKESARTNTMLEELAEFGLRVAKDLGCSDVSVIGSNSSDSLVRFSNNSITLVNAVRNLAFEIYLAKDRRRMLGVTYNPSEEGIKKFIANLCSSCKALPESEDYTPLPGGPFSYHPEENYDPKVRDANIVELSKVAIEKAIASGAKRVAGSLNSSITETVIRTSAGATASDRESMLLLNVRAFAEDNASGHGLSCSSYLSDFDPVLAGFTAGEYARMSLDPKQVPEGRYVVVFAPVVVANILPIAQHASAYAIESGNSMLVDKLEERIAVQDFSVDNFGTYKHGLGGRKFDSEGTPTEQTSIVQSGTFRSMLHNSTTAKKFGAKSTGNAGILAPHPFTVVFGGGTSSKDAIADAKEGIFVTNNWYTRYQNHRTGEYSTVPRDAAFWIEGGEITKPVAGFRISDSVPRQLENIEFISKERKWIKWWEVETPTLAPSIVVSGVQITRAVDT